MTWEMELDEIEAILEKIWDLHDKLSDAIHSISRTHFLNSVKALRKPEKIKRPSYDGKNIHNDVTEGEDRATGFVFVKDFRLEDESTIQEAKSLNAIRIALENLEDQLEFFHTVQMQQQAERDAAIARLEQSRIVLAMRLAEHHGKKYEVIEEALAFVRDAGHFVSPEKLFGHPYSPSGEKVVVHEEKRSNILIKFLVSSFDFAKKSLKSDQMGEMGGILGNAALVAVSMIAWLHLHQVAYKNHPQKREDIYGNGNLRQTSWSEESSQNQLDVLAGRG